MTTLAFDTHKAVKALQAAGAAEPLAEAVVATVGEAVGENVATKTDLAEVQGVLKAEIAEVQATLKAEIAEVRTEIAEVRTEIAEVKAELKADIAEVKTETAKVRTEIAEVKAELKTDLAALESRLHRQLWVMAAGIVGLTVALVKLTA